MKRIIALLGVRGAGKSTLLRSLAEHPHIKALKPTTNRAPRDGEGEYEFVERFPRSDAMAWEIQVGGYQYGVRNTQVKGIPDGRVGVTVFDPGSVAALERFRQQWAGEVVTIGLDTIMTVAEQALRVADDPSRKMTEEQFVSQREQVLRSDVVLRGEAELVENAVTAVCEILVSRGGLVGDTWLRPLIRAGALIVGADLDLVQPASYDLRFGSEVWCQGKRIVLTPDQPFFEIPPYSYAIVKAAETVKIPRFLAGKFDLTVSLFFKGVLLSNGPQVDPGYDGALFCTLFNGRDEGASIKKGDHFATIEFCTLGKRVDGYRGPYQGKQDLNDYLQAETGSGPGGDIIGRISNLERKLGEVRVGSARYWLAMIAIFVAVLTLSAGLQQWSLNTLETRAEKRLGELETDADRKVSTIMGGLSQVTAEAQARAAAEMRRIDQVGTTIDEMDRRLELLDKQLEATERHPSSAPADRPDPDGE